jgi:hypothetical protein
VRAGDQTGPQRLGLVFREGVMVFEPLQWDMAADPSRKVVPTGRTTTAPSNLRELSPLRSGEPRPPHCVPDSVRHRPVH